ncbi:L-threonylcarbamoyladenylate synthase [Geobacter sp. SVR]|uniref:L-threonylcarbamoyladenylate synthase n=1 Tax=Geobacter sp. SVR TaxID=2495594 RepID=UPI00143F003C|nr:L-threonylcarbamoyladenylate synthase [Geobacter sp. SVR]BCS54012.1 threonylcarbamoyl-AMP synthase [Geobacter sp. SVR]GCF86207.1 threonylcarbamoyl-AMP synthase [Geobacter sp. SVR]
MLLEIHPEHPQPRYIARVVECLRQGGIIAYPTDTTYGIGCSIFNKKGIERIYQMKRREHKKPFSFICPNISEIARYCRVSNMAYKILKRYLPGPYTFVLDATRDVPDLLVTRQKTVGIRIPDNRICIEIVQLLGNPIVTTSANLSGEEPCGDPRSIEDVFGHQLDIIVDGGLLSTDVSSVVSLVRDTPEVLRAGLGDVSWCS